MKAGVRELRRYQVLLIGRTVVKGCEGEGNLRTCEATVAMDLENEDRFDTWVGDAESVEATRTGMVSTSRAILVYDLMVKNSSPEKNSWD